MYALIISLFREDSGLRESFGVNRGLEQVLHSSGLTEGNADIVIVAVMAGIQDAGGQESWIRNAVSASSLAGARVRPESRRAAPAPAASCYAEGRPAVCGRLATCSVPSCTA